jgi:hypothetical protein
VKITKQQLKDIIREELAEARESHQHFKFPNKRNAEDFAQEIANSALATGKVKGDTVAVDISKVRKARTHKAIAKVMKKFKGTPDFKITFESLNENRSNYYFLMDPQGMRGEDGFYKRLATNDDSQFEFGHVYSATGWKNKAEAQRTLKRVKSSSSKYRNANLKVVRGDEIDESIEEGMGLVLNKEIFFGLQKLISKNAKNNKLKGYSSEVSHAVTDILVAVEEDRLAIGDVFNGLKTITRKIEK